MDNIKTPEDILNYMDNIKYGWIGTDNKKRTKTMRNFRKYYRTLSIEDTIKNKVGTALIVKKQAAEAAIVHTVTKTGVSNEGKEFTVGDRFKVLEVDGDVGLIEIMGDTNSPYYVSIRFLSSISDYDPK